MLREIGLNFTQLSFVMLIFIKLCKTYDQYVQYYVKLYLIFNEKNHYKIEDYFGLF